MTEKNVDNDHHNVKMRFLLIDVRCCYLFSESLFFVHQTYQSINQSNISKSLNIHRLMNDEQEFSIITIIIMIKWKCCE